MKDSRLKQALADAGAPISNQDDPYQDDPLFSGIKRHLDRVPPPVAVTSKTEVHPHWTMGGHPSAIEAQEARGQQELVNNTQLPVKCSPVLKAKLQYAGVVFGNETPDDKLFCYATLPTGWKKQATGHSMWSELVDDQGVKQAMIFYKAAFYDRDAFMQNP
jgi:hypothetical protein